MKTLAFGLTLSALVLPACVSQGKYRLLEDELARAQGDLARASGDLASAQDMLIDSEGRGSEMYDRAALAEQLSAENADLQAQLDKYLRDNTLFAPKNTEIIGRNGAYGYRVESDVLFASGSDKLTKAGKKVLSDVATELKRNDQQIIVEGHTDGDPVKKTIDLWPRGNMQLGAGRALTVKEFLVSQGVPTERVAIASYGPYRPISKGKSAADKAKNRRVEIMVSLPSDQT
jgi:chemotaxis protein MotB